MFQSVYGAQTQAALEFDRLHGKGIRHRMVNAVMGKSSDLVTFDSIREQFDLSSQHDAGINVVPIDNIIGTVGRSHEFDDSFYPKQENSRHRWCDVAAAIFAGRELPPVELYRVENEYYIIDGNHRISVLKSTGQEFVEAHVIDIELTDNRCQAKQTPHYDR